jgi:uncharacterized membrane protein YtjA (UPF0391 family)
MYDIIMSLYNEQHTYIDNILFLTFISLFFISLLLAYE